jgi:CheY-like chemotaxis protein
MPALLISSDLLVISKFQAAAMRQQIEAPTAASLDAGLSKWGEQAFDLVVLDLSLQGLDPAIAVKRLRALSASPRTIIAFGPHVHEERLAAARAAGCDRVLSRGQFDRSLDQILQGINSSAP